MVKKYDHVVGYHIFHPSFTYYLPDRIPVFKDLDSLKIFLRENKALVISRKYYTNDLESIGLKEKASVHDLFEGNTTILFTNPE